MKRIKELFKKTPKKIIAFVMILAMIFPIKSSITKVTAASYGTGDEFITFGLDNEHGFTINSVTINNETWQSSMDEFHTDDNQYTIIIEVSKNENTADKYPTIRWGGNWSNRVTMVGIVNENTWTYTITLNNANHINEQTQEQERSVNFWIDNSNSGEPGQGGENEPHFDGRAYVLWSCGTGTCYHLFENIPSFDNGNSTFYEDTTVTADNDNSKHFDVHAQYKAWALPGKFVSWVNAYLEQNNLDDPEDINWAQINPEDIISEYPPDMRQWEEAAVEAYENDHNEGCQRPGNNAGGNEWSAFEDCVDDYYIAAGHLPFIRLQPVGEPSANNAYVSYGDRNFKVVIYSSAYKGITLGDLSDLNYYPAHWTNAFLRTDQYDISGTSLEHPAKLESILLDNVVHFRPIAIPGNTLQIANVEALDVPDDALTITNPNGLWTITYASNFYDHVVFKVTDTNNQVYYIQVNRYTVDAYLNYVWDDPENENPEEQHPAITAEFYYERNKNYDDFELTAKIIYKDGTIETVPLTAIEDVDDGLGNVTHAFQVDQEEQHYDGFNTPLPTGKGLNKSVFRYDLQPGEERTIREAYVNVEKVGSTSDNYAGAYTGSGEGVKVKMGEDD